MKGAIQRTKTCKERRGKASKGNVGEEAERRKKLNSEYQEEREGEAGGGRSRLVTPPISLLLPRRRRWDGEVTFRPKLALIPRRWW